MIFEIYLKSIYSRNYSWIHLENYFFHLKLMRDDHYLMINLFFYFFCFFSKSILFFHIVIYFFLPFIANRRFPISVIQLFAAAVHFIFTTQFYRFCMPFQQNYKCLSADFSLNSKGLYNLEI